MTRLSAGWGAFALDHRVGMRKAWRPKRGSQVRSQQPRNLRDGGHSTLENGESVFSVRLEWVECHTRKATEETMSVLGRNVKQHGDTSNCTGRIFRRRTRGP